jgi:hypothetical protein
MMVTKNCYSNCKLRFDSHIEIGFNESLRRGDQSSMQLVFDFQAALWWETELVMSLRTDLGSGVVPLCTSLFLASQMLSIVLGFRLA